MKKNEIRTIGTINLENINIDMSGTFEMHLPLEDIGEQTDKILNYCMDDYKEKHPQTNTEEDVYFDFKLIYTSGFSNPEYSEYMADVYIWQKEGDELLEIYESIELHLDTEAQKKVKSIIWEQLGKQLLGL